MEKKIRAFFAIEIPNKKTLDAIIHYQTQLQRSIGPLKIVNRELMHITSRFLGNITPNIAEQLYHFMQEDINNYYFANGKTHEGQFKGVGDFRKRVFFIKIHGVNDLLHEINRKIEEKLLEFPSIKKENRKYHPHLTIARAKRHTKFHNNPGQLPYQQLKQKFKDYEFGPWTIKEIVLKKSVLTPTGPIYSNYEI